MSHRSLPRFRRVAGRLALGAWLSVALAAAVLEALLFPPPHPPHRA